MCNPRPYFFLFMQSLNGVAGGAHASIRVGLNRRLVQNAVALLGLQIATYVAPLITVPYLARVLHPTGWGLVAFSQGLASYLGVIVEFGFVFSATREVARYRDSRDKLNEIAAGVLGAKILLIGLITLGAMCLQRIVPSFRQHPALLYGAVLWSVGQGLSPAWYFQGVERMRLASTIEIAGKLIGCVLLFIFVHDPSDAWKVLSLFAVAVLLSAMVNYVVMYREIDLCWPSARLVRQTVQGASSLFLFRAVISVYAGGNAFLLGLFAPAATVAFYAGPEKIT